MRRPPTKRRMRRAATAQLRRSHSQERPEKSHERLRLAANKAMIHKQSHDGGGTVGRSSNMISPFCFRLLFSLWSRDAPYARDHWQQTVNGTGNKVSSLPGVQFSHHFIFFAGFMFCFFFDNFAPVYSHTMKTKAMNWIYFVKAMVLPSSCFAGSCRLSSCSSVWFFQENLFTYPVIRGANHSDMDS